MAPQRKRIQPPELTGELPGAFRWFFCARGGIGRRRRKRREQLNNRGRFGLVRGGSNPSRHITWKDDLNNGGDAGKTCTKLATD
jgi:hypothetical protein